MRVVEQLGGALDKGIGKKLSQYEKQIDNILRKTGQAAKGSGSNFGGSLLGMGSISQPAGGGRSMGLGLGTIGGRSAEFTANGPGPVRLTQPTQGGGGFSGLGISGSQIASGLGRVAMGAAAVGYGMLPDTADAVAQNLTAQSVASMNGMSVRNIITGSNKFLAGGMTSNYGAQEAAAAMAYSGGYLYGGASANNLLRTTGGFSIMTGLSNARVASAQAGVNGMNLLRLGVQARDRQGNMLGTDQIAAQLYRRTYGNRKISSETAAAVFNPGSVAYANTMAAAGGNQDMFQMLAQYQVQMAKNGGRALNVADTNKVFDSMGIGKDSPYRKNFRYQGSEAGKLEKTGDSLVQGYGAALDAVSAVNEGFNNLTGPLDAVVQGMSKLAGFLDTLPAAGNTGGTIGGLAGSLASTAGGAFGNYLQFKGIQAGVNAFRASRGLPTVGSAVAETAVGRSLLARVGGAAGLAKFGLAGGSMLAKGGSLLLGGAAYMGTNWAMDKGYDFLKDKGKDLPLWVQNGGNVAYRTLQTGASWGAAAGAATRNPAAALAAATAGSVYGLGKNLWDWAFDSGEYSRGKGFGGGDQPGYGGDTGASMANAAAGYGAGGGGYRTPQQAAQWALSQVRKGVSGWQGLCEKFARSSYGLPGQYHDAAAHWKDAVRKGRAHRGSTPPVGALVYWTGGSKGYGHAAVSIGGGKIVSTDIKRKGKADVVSIAYLNRAWGNLKYEGWADPPHTRVSSSAQPIAATEGANVSSGNPVSSFVNSVGRAVQSWFGYSSRPDTAAAAASTGSSTVSLSGTSSLSAGMSGIQSSAAITVSDLLAGSSGGYGGPSDGGSTGSGAGRSYTVNMNVNIARATNEEAARLAKQVKAFIEDEHELDRIGTF